jgi:hypothetical protein
MDEPSRSPYWLDLDNGPVFRNRDRILKQSGIPPSPFLFLQARARVLMGERTLGIGPVAQVVRAHA